MRKLFPLVLVMVAACSSALQTQEPVIPVIKSTLTPTETLTPTKTLQPTPTRTKAQAIEPYTIEGLRDRKYDKGIITIREMLLETDQFTRYLIEYPSDGLTITGIMQIPKTGEAPFPVIVMNHGFFSRYIYRSGDGTDRAAEFLNHRGYLTVASDYRSWGGSDLGESLFYSGQVIDVIHLINALPSVPQADTTRIGMWGHSMGGGITAKVLTIVGDRIKAAVLYSSVSADFSDVIGRWGTGCLGDILVSEQTYGCNSSDILPGDFPEDISASYFDATTDPVMLKAVSPLYHFDLVSARVQVVYGTEDGKTSAGTPPEWSRKMHQAFVDAGVDSEIFSYQGEGHSFIGDPWFVFMAKTQLFFDKYVK